ncbi:hypothetical protein Tco_0648785 [Tanacetum coccineum]
MPRPPKCNELSKAQEERTGTQDAIDAAIADRLADLKEVNAISENHVGVLLFVLSLGIKYDNEVNKVGKISKIYIVASRIMNDDEVFEQLMARKVHACKYDAKESPIPPPTIVHPSSMLSPMFNPQEFFLPEELLPLKKRGRDHPPLLLPFLKHLR